ncbi:S-layer homology domain-containing protein [Paenibacillus sp. 1011MAR3C5]|uniref:S-layer homology domain-containing protein n=1 Tax=Paenibacillus sp. 1011MAR3C5 TaxID=1675787 RepID=UPI000E6BF508|nr:S-layer homology domain-containing protein [Paenibacillus sp. 1011MAR3C5]RJE85551.1 S-layer homology domain-containing protein [Paenibacillus sp. 1011MAR3C5]
MSVRIRKTLALSLATALLAGLISVPVAYADNEAGKTATKDLASGNTASSEADGKDDQAMEKGSIDKAQAEKLLRQYINIPSDYKLQSSNSSSIKKHKGSSPVWGMEFVKTVNGKRQGSIYASIDADSGQLLSFESYTNQANAKPVYPLKVNREAAQKLAADFISEIAADYTSQVTFNTDAGVHVLPPLSGEVRHELRYDRMVNGIPYIDNYIQLSIDSEGHVLQFRLEWDDTIVFPASVKPISQEEASASIRKHAVPELAYFIPYSGQKKEPVLYYGVQPVVINAETGGQLPGNGYSAYNRQEVSKEPLSAEPLAKPPLPVTLTQEEAAAAVEKAFALAQEYKLQNASFSEYVNEADKSSTRWNLEWSAKKDGKDIGFVHASVDGRTGAISEFYSYQNGKGGEAAEGGITLDKAVERAIDIVKKQLPWQTHEIYLQKPAEDRYKDRTPEEIGSYYITFVRKVHGATVTYDHISVAIHAMTGAVENYSANLSDYAYPEQAPKTVDRNVILDRFEEYYNIGLTYRLFSEYRLNGEPIPVEKYQTLLAAGLDDTEEITQQSKVELVYQQMSKPRPENVVLDAITGEWRSNETGEPTQLEIPKATDAEGHWAEESLGLMVAYKALDLVEGKVRPNEAITRGELIKMLVLARSGGRQFAYDTASEAGLSKASFNDVAADSAYFAYVESALQQNLIDLGDGSFNPDAKVSRDEMAELIVRALGYNSLADYDHIFKANFKDSKDIANTGQAAIVVGLRIMNLTDGKFLPKKQVTRAEASIAFFRYLQKRAELQEAPLRM